MLRNSAYDDAQYTRCCLLNEVLSLNAQECAGRRVNVSGLTLLNEVLSLNAQESRLEGRFHIHY